MQQHARLVAVVVALVLGACGRSAPNPAAALAGVTAPPSEVLAVASVASLESALGDIGAYVDTIKPGMSRSLSPEMVWTMLGKKAHLELPAGVDKNGTVHVVMVERLGPVVFLRATDEAAVKSAAPDAVIQGGWAAFGPKPAVAAAAPWAFANLCGRAAPAALTLSMWPADLMATHGAALDGLRARFAAGGADGADAAIMGGAAMSKIMGAYLDGLQVIISDTDRVSASLSFAKDTGHLEFALVPRAGSDLAKLQAAQAPSDYALLDQLPDTSRAVLAVGRASFGPYHDRLVGLLRDLLGLVDASPEMTQALEAAYASLDGSFAASLSLGGDGFLFDEIAGLTDPAAMSKATALLVNKFASGKAIDIGELKATMKTLPAVATHDGVSIDAYEFAYDLAAMTDVQRAAITHTMPGGVLRELFAVVDDRFAIHMGGDAASMNHVIDTIRKGERAPRSEALQAAIAESRDRHESTLCLMDMASLMAGITGQPATHGGPIVFAMGASDNALQLRISLPSATVKGLIALSTSPRTLR